MLAIMLTVCSFTKQDTYVDSLLRLSCVYFNRYILHVPQQLMIHFKRLKNIYGKSEWKNVSGAKLLHWNQL